MLKNRWVKSACKNIEVINVQGISKAYAGVKKKSLKEIKNSRKNIMTHKKTKERVNFPINYISLIKIFLRDVTASIH